MKTYTAIWDKSGTKLFEGVLAKDLIGKLPTGSQHVSSFKKDKYGNIVEKKRNIQRPKHPKNIQSNRNR